MVKNEEIFVKSKENNENVINMTKEFSTYDETINKDQYKLIEYLWGFNEVKTPKELNEIFIEINKNFSYIKYYLSGITRLKNLLMENRK